MSRATSDTTPQWVIQKAEDAALDALYALDPVMSTIPDNYILPAIFYMHASFLINGLLAASNIWGKEAVLDLCDAIHEGCRKALLTRPSASKEVPNE